MESENYVFHSMKFESIFQVNSRMCSWIGSPHLTEPSPWPTDPGPQNWDELCNSHLKLAFDTG